MFLEEQFGAPGGKVFPLNCATKSYLF